MDDREAIPPHHSNVQSSHPAQGAVDAVVAETRAAAAEGTSPIVEARVQQPDRLTVAGHRTVVARGPGHPHLLRRFIIQTLAADHRLRNNPTRPILPLFLHFPTGSTEIIRFHRLRRLAAFLDIGPFLPQCQERTCKAGPPLIIQDSWCLIWAGGHLPRSHHHRRPHQELHRQIISSAEEMEGLEVAGEAVITMAIMGVERSISQRVNTVIYWHVQ